MTQVGLDRITNSAGRFSTRAVARRVLAGAQHRQEQISAPPVESVTSTPSQHRCLPP